MTYSPGADALGIWLVQGESGRGTKELAPNVFADWDDRGRLMRLEILNASRFYDRTELEQLGRAVTWLSLIQAAKESGMSPAALREEVRTGRLRAEKRGRRWVVGRHELWGYMAKGVL